MMAKTTCDWTVERLPWWVNGTLEEAEAERVAAHLAECAACREELAATRGALALYSVHLPIETLLDVVEDEAAESYRAADGAVLSRQVVDEHLGHCQACRAELSLLRESRAAVEADPAAPGVEAPGVSTPLVDRPAGTVTPFAPRRFVPPPPGREGRGFEWRSVALAASILLVVVAGGGWLGTARTAERRADLLVELERRYSEALAARTADERGAEPPAPGEAPDESAAALAAAAQREAELAAEIAALKAENARLQPAAEGGERMAEAVGVGQTVMWSVQPGVTRGGEERRAAAPVEVAVGAEHVSLFLTHLPDEPLRLVVEGTAGRLVLDDLQVFDDRALGRHSTVTLSLAELPEGELRLRLFADGEEIGTLLLPIAR